MSVLATPSAWPAILERIRQRISPQQFATWFQNLRAESARDDQLSLRVPNRFFKEWLAQNYTDIIEEAVREVTGRPVSIVFTIDDSIGVRPRESRAEPVFEPPPARPQGLRLNDQYTFDAFIVGPSNQLAHAAAVAVSRNPGRTYNPLFVYGSVGLGKSHLLQAICHALLGSNRRARVAYLSCETFVNEFISAIQRNDLDTFRDHHRQLDLLLIDDIQFLSRAERSQEEFFHTFNDLYNAQRQIVLTSDQSPQELTGLEDRLISRFKSGLVARIDPPSYEMRVAILKKKAELRHVALPADVVEYIASTITTNIRELDGAVTKVLGYASLLGQAITLDVAKTALHEPPVPRPPVSIEEILRLVTQHFGVRPADLQSKKRTRSIVLPRQICMHLARECTMLSLEEIGGYFGGRDHSTVLHADEKIWAQMRTDPALNSTIARLKAKLGNAGVS